MTGDRHPAVEENTIESLLAKLLRFTPVSFAIANVGQYNPTLRTSTAYSLKSFVMQKKRQCMSTSLSIAEVRAAC